jgi:hypothetical protein
MTTANSVCTSFSAASSEFGQNKPWYVYPRSTKATSPEKIPVISKSFKEHIYLHYFLRMLHSENLSRMSIALGQPRNDYSTHTELKHEAYHMKCSTNSVTWAMTNINCYNINDYFIINLLHAFYK